MGKFDGNQKGYGHTTNSIKNISTGAQRKRLKWALELAGKNGISTIQAREILNIISPAPRIYELRNKGYDILTHWIVHIDAQGNKHRVAKYVLEKSR
ncbi:MAG: helix-turn-helix domain-containing protein [Cytophagia bacterium]|nr:helix-turn-helix domain-containing protein [Cytophagia bacterium]